MATDLTAARLREVLDYNPETGEFRWRVFRPGLSAYAKPVGWINPYKGRRIIRVDGRTYRAARLAWLHVYGEWPQREVDHIDGDKLNDRIANLRDVSRVLNEQNKIAARGDKVRGTLRGAHPAGGKWHALIQAGGQSHRLGTFPTEAEAHAAYLEAKRRLHHGFVEVG